MLLLLSVIRVIMQTVFLWWLCEAKAEAEARGQDLTLFERRDESQRSYENFRRQHIQEEPSLKQERALHYCPVSPWCGAPESSFPQKRGVTCDSGILLSGFSPAGSLQPRAQSLLRNQLGVWQVNTLFSLDFLRDFGEG